MRVVVVGGAGFIGMALSRVLRRAGREVVLLDTSTRLSRPGVTTPGMETHAFDFASDRSLDSILREGDRLVHLGCTTNPAKSMQTLVYDAESNIGPSVRLFEAAARAGVDRVVFASSGGTVYGRPTAMPVVEDAPTRPLSGYGVSKLAIEHYLQLFDQFTGISLRVANPYGPDQLGGATVGVIARFVDHVRRGEALHVWGDGSVVRDYVAIEDVANAFERALFTPTLGSGVFNVGSGEGVSINEIIELVFRATGRRVEVTHEPARSYDVPAIVLDSSAFHAATGWTPSTTLLQGIHALWMDAQSLSEG